MPKKNKIIPKDSVELSQIANKKINIKEQWKNLMQKAFTFPIDDKGLSDVFCYEIEDFFGKTNEGTTYQCKKLIFTDYEFAYSLLTSSKNLIEQFEFCRFHKLTCDVKMIRKKKLKFWVLSPNFPKEVVDQ